MHKKRKNDGEVLVLGEKYNDEFFASNNLEIVMIPYVMYDVEVKGTDVAEFLEDKLALLGLNEREAEEFIVYWLPKLQENKYNYIRFATMEEINENMH